MLLRRSRRISITLAGTLAVVLATSVATGASPLPGSSAAVGAEIIPDAESAGTAAEAVAIAAAHDHSVVVESELTETSTTSVNPDGTLVVEIANQPVRVERGDEWVDVDLDLVRGADGWITPAASATGIRFGDGGAALASIQTGTDEWVSESWDIGELPRPLLEGRAATYADVLPDVDLVLTATPTGMTEVLVVHTEAAAAIPELATVELEMHGATLSTGPEGGIVARADDGSEVIASVPTWWDSSHPASDVAGPGSEAPPLTLAHVASETTVALDVASTIQENEIVYPLYIDPDWKAGASPFWMTDRNQPNQSYLNGQYANGNQSVGLGSDNTGTYLSRSFWQFNVSGLAGKTILASQIALTQADQFNMCSKVPVQAWRYSSGLGPGFSWNEDINRPDGWDQRLSTVTPCLTGAGLAFGMDTTAGVAETSRVGAGSIIIGLRSSDEGNGGGRRHLSQAATLRVSYNSDPATPTNFSWVAPPRSCGPTSADPAFMNGNQNLVMRMKASDPDGGTNVRTTFRVVSASNGADTKGTFTSPLQAQGTVQVTIPAKTFGDGRYAVQATTSDGTDTSAPSPYCFFTIKNSAPDLPLLAGPSGAKVGTPIGVTITPSVEDQVRGFAYWWSTTNRSTPAPPLPTAGVVGPASTESCAFIEGVVTYVCAADSGGTKIYVAPVDETSTLYVASYDKAGNVSYEAATKSNAAGLEIRATADPAAALPSGHAWELPVSGPLPPTLADRGSTSLPLTTGAGMDTGVSAAILPGPERPVLDYDNLLQLNRFNGSTHAARTGSAPPGGMQFEGTMGQIYLPGKAERPMNTIALYSCALPTGDMTSPSATCEGTGVTGVLLGYIWRWAANVPTGMPTNPVYRCVVDTDKDHFLSLSASCEGQRVDGLLGYLADVKQTKTASSAVDTTKSFSVSVWVNLTENNPAHAAAYTAVSQEGSYASGFYLQAKDGEWRFCIRSQPRGAAECAAGPKLTTGTWVYLTGVWDATNKQARLLTGFSTVPVGAEPVISHVSPSGDVSANGPLVIGSAKSAGAQTDMWFGQIHNPIITPGVVSSSQLYARYYDQL